MKKKDKLPPRPAPLPPPPPEPGFWGKTLLWLMVPGVFATYLFRSSFHYDEHDIWWGALGWAFLVLFPFFVYQLRHVPRHPAARARYPGEGRRQIHHWMLAAVTAAATLISVIGWLIMVSVFHGPRPRYLPAEVTSVTKRFGAAEECDEYAWVGLADKTYGRCLDDDFVQGDIQPGDKVEIRIARYPFGANVTALRRISKAAPGRVNPVP